MKKKAQFWGFCIVSALLFIYFFGFKAMALHQDLVFAELTEASIGPLRLLNASIFPLPYDEKFYRDLLKQKELSRYPPPAW